MAVREYIPKNIKTYKPKVYKGLTAPQIIAGLIAGVIVYVLIKLLPESWSTEPKVIFAGFFGSIPFLLTLDVYGQPVPKAIKEIFFDYFVNPPKRVYNAEEPVKHKAVKLDKKNKPLSMAVPVKSKKCLERIKKAEQVKPFVEKIKEKKEKPVKEKIKAPKEKPVKNVKPEVNKSIKKEKVKNENTKGKAAKGNKEVKKKHTGLYPD